MPKGESRVTLQVRTNRELTHRRAERRRFVQYARLAGLLRSKTQSFETAQIRIDRFGNVFEMLMLVGETAEVLEEDPWPVLRGRRHHPCVGLLDARGFETKPDDGRAGVIVPLHPAPDAKFVARVNDLYQWRLNVELGGSQRRAVE